MVVWRNKLQMPLPCPLVYSCCWIETGRLWITMLVSSSPQFPYVKELPSLLWDQVQQDKNDGSPRQNVPFSIFDAFLHLQLSQLSCRAGLSYVTQANLQKSYYCYCSVRAFQGVKLADNTGGDGQVLKGGQMLAGDILSTQVDSQSRQRCPMCPTRSHSGFWHCSAEFTCAFLPQRCTVSFKYSPVFDFFLLNLINKMFCFQLAGRTFWCVKPPYLSLLLTWWWNAIYFVTYHLSRGLTSRSFW